MSSTKVHFTNKNGYELSAKLELPVDQLPHTFAIFAHCFTCNKNLSAVRNISRALNMEGIAVLRFDFTGLGESEGDFADTNFTSNIQDLMAAAEFLSEEYMAPAIMIGHSLGGAAAICAGSHLESVKAIATVGSPAAPEHVSHLLGEDVSEIEEEGAATVNISGRSFKVKKQFLEDIREQNLDEQLKNMRKAILFMHSPQDEVVSIENAATLYERAFHPKSFISLDGADHLLSDKEDSQYVGQMIGSWAKRYIDLPKKEKLNAKKQVAVRLGEKGFTTEVMVRKHHLTADEPESVGGNDFGPTPYELVAAGLGACTAMTLQMYARRKKWDLREVTVHLDHYKDYTDDFQNPDDKKSQIDHFDRTIIVEGELDKKQKDRLLEIADRCPVHRTLHQDVKVLTEIKEEHEGANKPTK
ncbi:MAG: alpha/beta fold hydrolase [Bacteroidetes bacterium]|nr:alpha/beta fold hydrolase [Bacteroidota bacterium]